MSDKDTRVRELCKAMDAESIFHLSLHSKELFHSNILAWLCEKHPSVARKIFENWVPQRDTTNHRVLREHKSIDLIIELPGLAPIVLENKVFAPIDESQLERYSDVKNLEKIQDPVFICLGLGAPGWAETGFTTPLGFLWQYVSYRDLVARLSEVVHLLDGFDRDLALRYAKFILLLQDLSDSTASLQPSDAIATEKSIKDQLRKIRMHDAFDKLRSRTAMVILEKSLASEFDLEDVEFKTAFTNGEPLMEAFVLLPNGDRVGWQLQGIQWRLAVRSASFVGNTDELTQRRHDYVESSYATWFDFSALLQVVGGFSDDVPRTEKKGQFNRFNPDFVYRYRKVSGLTVMELQSLAAHYINRALELRSSVV